MDQSSITVSRTSEADVKQRQILVDLDGNRIAELTFGKSITRKVPPGRHELRVDNTWNRKKAEFDLAPGEHARFQTLSRAGRFTWFLVAAFGAGPMYVSLEREP
ncbi:MAG TPA: hypothetical protein VFA04_06485 [Bryobacteraceae bacterium]|jgi:hypothetical protein|nr:hypothetical protein [Bryobacteraceae bacterium]